MVALSESKHIMLVTQLDLPCLRNVVRLMMSFDEYEGMKDKVKVVVNRTGLANEHIGLKKAQETISSEIFAKIPNDYRSMAEARNNGVPLAVQAPKAAITQAVLDLAIALDRAGTDAADDTSLSIGKSNENVGAKKGWIPFLGK